MREILFRGRRRDTGVWIQGDFSQDKDLGTVYISGYTYYSDADGLQREPYCFEVDPQTIGQFTGLTDHNGTKIFEGDIVNCWDTNSGIDFKAVIEFGNPNGKNSWGYQLHPITIGYSNLEILLWIDMDEFGVYCQVIGNIHDNPKLLKE